MSKKYVVPSIFTAVDKFSGPVNKMSRNAESSMARMERKFRKVGDRAFSISRQSAMMGAAIIGPLALATNQAVKFEKAMADVAKVANVDIGSKQFNELGEKAKKLGVELAVDAKEAAALMAGLAQGGVAIDDLDRVARIAGKMGVAFGVTGDVAGEMFIKTRNALGGTIEDTEKVMDTINMFGNTTAAASDQLLTFMAKGGSAVAKAAKASGSELAAFGSQFISMGKSAEESGTIMQRFIKKALMNEDLRPVFDKAGGGAEGMLAIIEKGSKLAGKAQDDYFQNFGEYGLQIQLMANNFEGLREKVDASRDAVKNAGSVQAEFDNISQTSAFKLEQMKSRATALAITVGNALIPVVSDLVEAVTPVIEKFSTWVSENRGTVKTIMKVAAVVGGLALAVSAVSLVVGVATKAFAIYKYGVIGFNAVVKAARIAQIAWNAAMMANPIGLFIGVALAAGAAVYALSSAFKSQSREQRLNNEVQKRALDNTIDQRVEVGLLFNKLRKLNPESSQYQKTLAKVEQIQPGITKQYNLQAGALEDINRAEKELIGNIMKRAKEEARAELIREKMKKSLEAGTRDLSAYERVEAGISGIFIGEGVQVEAKNMRMQESERFRKDAEFLSKQQADAQLNPEDQRVSNPAKAQSISTSSMVKESTKEQIELTMGEDLKGLLMMNRKNGNGGGGLAMPGVPNTN